MRATITPTDLLATRGRVNVLRVLWQSRAPLTAAEIARRAGLTYPATSTVLDSLLGLRVIERSPAGRGHTHWLVRDNEYVRAYVSPLFKNEEEMPERLEDYLRSLLGDRCLSVVLFGSYARGDQTTESDVDVIAVPHTSEEKARLGRELFEIQQEFRGSWGAALSVIPYDPKEAATLQERAPGLYQSLEGESLTVSGLPLVEWRNLATG